MATPTYVRAMRARIGQDLLLLPGVTGVVRDDHDRVLLTRRSDNGRWSLPAGMVEPGEQPADAVLREVFEETGVHARIESIGGVATHPVEYPNGDRCEYLNVWFRCRATGGAARVGDDESVDVAWFAPGALPEIDEWSRLRIATTTDPAAPAWHARPGERQPALLDPAAL